MKYTKDQPLRRDKVEELGVLIGSAVKAHLEGAPAPAKLLEALNALAISAGTVIAGTDTDPHAVGFFLSALCQIIHEKGGLKLDVLVREHIDEPGETSRMGWFAPDHKGTKQ